MILDIIYAVLIIFLIISLVFIILILTQKYRHKVYLKRVNQARDYIFKKYIDKEEVEKPVTDKFFLDALIDVDEQIKLDVPVRKKIIAELDETKFINKQKKNLNSHFTYRRLIAVYYIGRLNTREGYTLLINRFSKEKNEAVKLGIIQSVTITERITDLEPLIESLINSSADYQQRLAIILGNNYERIGKRLVEYTLDRRFEIMLLLIRISEFNPGAILLDYLEKTLSWLKEDDQFNENEKYQLKEALLKSLLKNLPDTLKSFCNNSDDMLVKIYAIKSLEKNPDIEYLKLLIEGYDQSEIDRYRTETLARIVENESYFLDYILRSFSSFNTYQKSQIIIAISNRIEYIVLNNYTSNLKLVEEIILLMMDKKITEPLIDFLDMNTDELIEDALMPVLKKGLAIDLELTKEFRAYLKTETLKKLSLQPLRLESIAKPKPPKEKGKIVWISSWIAFTILLFPIIYLIRINVNILNLSPKEFFEGFLIDVNVYLIFYFVAINSVYIILFILALIGSRRTVNLAKTKKFSLLFTDKLLPGISIIAPAYNEEKSIIESVTSLLNLKYPNYEVIVVNDGSKDDTLSVMINHFNLIRIHSVHENSLNTKKIRGVYITKDIPNLVIVDKYNGGKADALNTGVNVASKTFICGIDADSILEGDALLKLASAMLDNTKPVLAMGGNIYPANGFTLNKGQVEKRAIPKESLCRFQTIEYLRAFTSGRIGWSSLKSLMIISGAFGLFERKALISSGGYLTSSGAYKKDTVGEDMELVVRLTTQALAKKEPHRVQYVYNAYCYTELPSDLKTLLKQRNRWQRGLLDILSFHRKIAFKPKYKQIGFIGYPYFFFFEFLGPFLELLGYTMLILALALGLLNTTIVLAIFTASIGFGVVVSLSSLFMTERDILMMNTKETLILLLYAVLENFGYRQMISIHRVFSSFSALKESGQWGSQNRKGFKT
jgi:cellulose synthase/poly-beta-1,6-N-acetylglucosamine synthase-like glycosyltransferase/HEAT repeat protein